MKSNNNYVLSGTLQYISSIFIDAVTIITGI